MGYDLRWACPPEGGQAAFEHASAALRAAEAALDALPQDEAGVFVEDRLQDVLEGLVDPHDHALYKGRTARWAAAWDAMKAARAAREAAQVWYRGLSTTQMMILADLMASLGMIGPDGIAPGQFVLNDGHTIPAGQCANAVDVWRRIVQRSGEDAILAAIERSLGKSGGQWWLSWIAYLEGAAAHGGLIVR